ncbi:MULTISPECIES: GAF domain-containing sensor histidine kinase [unclassified Rhodococcus (in: high G+C Gram-positive bacteria)]|uniref:GAF domain-containing sensor histidine kinase n=1 Tax=unclassified Rhodococcus (in: high G+C Gram-positive bacteria) TaxID=192944 RepID=UPI00163A8F2B|nr:MULTISPECIES: GAF domain-containing protein [unclassified Rhodococcus (in: high G+C Gram-positive bacteria)]MBC2637649.1 GAF domain-containing protein [Rhodococcus sp. 3A]MBC2897607.1 GAF domain-containing protein [Rhodococcus sp. 4CII]
MLSPAEASEEVEAPTPLSVATSFVRRALKLLPVDGVRLLASPSYELLGAAGICDESNSASIKPSVAAVAALDAPIVVERFPEGALVALPVVAGDKVVATLELYANQRWSPDRRESAVGRMLARCAEQLFDSEGELLATVSEDRAMLLGALTLVDATSVPHDDQLLGAITALLAPLADASSVGIAVVNQQGYLQMLPGSFGASDALVASSQLSRTEANSAAAEVFNRGRTLLANAPSRDASRFPEWIEGYGITRLMTVPLAVAGKPLGVLHLANKSTDFNDTDARRAEALAPFVAGVIQQACRRRDIGRKEAVAAVVSRAATAVAAGEWLGVGSAAEGLEYFLDDLRRVLGATTAAVVPSDHSGPPTYVGSPLDAGPASRAFEAGMRGSVTLRSSVSRPQAPGESGWTTLYVPIAVEGRGEGHLALLRIPCEPFRKHERAAVIQMSNIIALSWTTERYRLRQAEIARLRERERIADDIHDHVAQTLFGGKITMQSLISQMPEDSDLRLTADRALGMLVRSEQSLREAIYGLAGGSRQRAGLADRLVDAVHELEEQFAVAVELVAQSAVLAAADSLPEPVTVAVVAAAREAVINAVKHARASEITVEVAQNEAMRLDVIVRDNGIGSAVTAEGYGRRAMSRKLAAQGASVEFQAAPGGGTEVQIHAPLTVRD